MRALFFFSRFVAGTVIIYSTAFADYQSSLTQACEHLSVACKELSSQHEEQCNPLYLPVEKCCFWGTLNLYAEYLWWKQNQVGLHYAISGVINDPPAAGKLFAINGDWDSGFRIGAAILFPCNAWKVGLDWLRFTRDATDSSVAGSLTLRATRALPASDVDTLTFAQSDYDFKLDSIRLALTVPLFTRAHFSFNPWIAIRADYLRNNFNIFYQATGTDTGIFSHILKYCGGGPEFGLDTRWYFLPCVALFGELNGAGLYGRAKTQQTFTDNNGDEDVNFIFDTNRLQTTLGTQIGVQWEGRFFRNIFTSLRLAWETNIWFNFNTIYSFVSSVEEGNLVNVANDLHTTGLTFRGAIAF